MSSPEVFIECPYCKEKRANFKVLKLWQSTANSHGRINPDANLHGEGVCFICGNKAYLFFKAVPVAVTAPTTHISLLPKHLPNAKTTNEGLRVENYELQCIQTFPEPEALECPDHLAEEVAEVFLEADANFKDQRWRSAVTGYGTAIDFAALQFIDGEREAALKLPLGGKMKKLRGQGLLPPSLIDLMEIANLERRISVHYTEPVDERAARAARSVTVATLEYLFTLPKQIDEARERFDKASTAPQPGK